MRDQYNRNIEYLRISITDRCNLRCKYCMPKDSCNYTEDGEAGLTDEEILQVVKVAAKLGISKIKVTGGEPLLRNSCTSLIEKMKAVEGIHMVTLTTNGVLLEQYLDKLVSVGVDGINVSLDTLNPRRYEEITGQNHLSKVLKGIYLAVESGVRTKINVATLEIGDGNLENWNELLQLTRDLPVDVRFIEIMPIGMGKSTYGTPHNALISAIRKAYPGIQEDNSFHGNGPAVYYRIPGFQGSIGFISAVHASFCNKCNRIRLTNHGELKSCLCYQAGNSLLPILRSGKSPQEVERLLEKSIRYAIYEKPKHHSFNIPDRITETKNMCAIGG